MILENPLRERGKEKYKEREDRRTKVLVILENPFFER